MDREEVAHLRGRRLDDIWSKIAAEQDDAKAKGIALPEEDENAAVAFKRDVVKAFIADGTVSDVMANKTDLGKLVSEAGLPEYKAYQEPLLPIVAQAGPLVSGDVITDEEGDPVGGDVLESSGGKDKVDDAGDAVPDGTPNDAAPANDKSPETHADVVPPARKRGKRVRLAIATRPPKYRNAEQGEQSAMCCGTCSYLLGDVCQKFNVKVDAGHVCDAWEAKPVSAKDSSPTKKMGPYTPDGEKPLDLQFFPDAEKRDVGTIGPN
jgi:hypothetical protein